MGFFPFLFSSDYMLFILPGFILVMLAQFLVNSTYRKWGRVRNRYGMTGEEAARRLLSYGGLNDVSIEGIGGQLSDHYDPRTKTLRLSPGIAKGESIAALAVTAHEIGHALQDRQGYLPLRFRAAIVPAVNIGSWLGYIMIIGGILLRLSNLAWLGIVFFSLGAVFSLATLPVELNASVRARRLLSQAGLVHADDEARGVSAVLNAAAFTYVAALAAALLQLLYWIMAIGGLGGRRRG
ncbi:MAG TPA: zinc metallopeptidase [Anaerolineales bacterium]|nr:zinc metallopeptidase [Anaerolineales bacterium]